VFADIAKYNDLLLSLREFGRLPPKKFDGKRASYKDKVLGYYDTRYVFQYLGYNVRMTDVEAAMGIEQLKKLDNLNRKRIRVVEGYSRGLKKFENWLQLPMVAKGALHTFYGYPLIIKRGVPFNRKEISLFLEKNGIETRPFFAGCLPDQPGFRNQPKRIVGALPVSRWIRDNAIFIGCHPALTRQQRKKVIKTFEDFFNGLGMRKRQ
ncbi:MAG: DegT/DnrJ/EryC1/StrS family aminotransferase, partial [Patescibacteria group bacterium]